MSKLPPLKPWKKSSVRLTEATVKKDLSKKLKAVSTVAGKLWYYMPVQSAFGVHGIPDYILCVPTKITQEMVGGTIGRFAALETKSECGVLSDHQAIQRANILRATGEYHIVDNLEFPLDALMCGWLTGWR